MPDTATPFMRLACPVCGGPNACVPAAVGSFDVRCWCVDAEMPVGARAALATRGGDAACACAACLVRLGARVPEAA